MRLKHLLRTALMAFTLMLWTGVGWGQGLEDFTNFPETSTTYNTGTFIGNDGSTWSYVKTSGPSAEAIAAPTPMLGRNQSPAAEITSGIISGGIGNLSFDFKQAFSTNVNLEVWINTDLVTTITTSSEQDIIKNTGIITVNVTGDFTISFKQPVGAGQVCIDNITWTGYTGGSTNDATSYVDATGVTQPAAAEINSILNDDVTEAIPVFKFNIADAASGDGLSTFVTAFTFKTGLNHTVPLDQPGIGGASLYDETATSDILYNPNDVVVTANTVTIPLSTPLEISDGTNHIIRLSIWLSTEDVPDGGVIEFMIDADAHGFTADGASGSTFAADFGTDVVSNQFTIDVDASQLQFTTQPVIAEVNAVMSPAVEVAATDANGNVDLDIVDNVTLALTGSGAMGGTATVAAVSGVATFSDLTFNTIQTGATLTATSGVLTQAISDPFEVTDIQTGVLIISEYIEGGSNNKAIELYNPSAGTVDLGRYTLYRSSNGGDWLADPEEYLTGVLPAGGVYVLGNASAAQDILDVADITSSITFFNGNDAVGLFFDGTLVDVFGDPLSADNFDVAGVTGAGANHTIVRKQSVTAGNTNWALSAGTNADDSEWFVFGQDDFTYLGTHNPISATIDPATGEHNLSVPNNVATTINWFDAASVASIVEDVNTLTLGDDYTVVDNTLTILASYFSGATAGDMVFTINFNEGDPATFTVTVVELVPVETPTIDPNGGTFYEPVTVTLATATDGATIYYTTNGDDPTTGSTEYTAPFQLTTTTTVKTFAVKGGMGDSDIATATFTLPEVNDVEDIATLRSGLTDGTIYRLTGEAVLTFQSAYRNCKYIQDETGAILIDDNLGTITTSYNIYDGITGIIGTLSTYNSMLQFVPVADPGTATSSGNAVTPEEITLSNLTSDKQGKLVKVRNASFGVTGNFAKTNYTITDASGSGTLRPNYDDLDYIGTAIPEVPQIITGVVLQYNATTQLIPRSLSDFVTPYTITINEVSGGTADVVTSPAVVADENETITITISNIQEGKRFNSIVVKDSDLGDVTVNEVAYGVEYNFTMPAKNVDITVTVEDKQYVTFYFQGPSWMDNDPHNPEVWGPFMGAGWTGNTLEQIPNTNWWSKAVEVTDATVEITYQMRFSQAGTTKYQKKTNDFGADPVFTTSTNEIFVDGNDNGFYTWSGDDFYLVGEAISESAPDNYKVAIDRAALGFEDFGFGGAEDETAVKSNFTLPVLGEVYSSTITWASSNTDAISISGSDATVTRPLPTKANAVVDLTATIENGTANDTKVMQVTVLEDQSTFTPELAVAGDKTTGVPFNINLTSAVDADGVALDGDINVTVNTDQTGKAEVFNANATFTAGEATITVTLNDIANHTLTISVTGVTETKELAVNVIAAAEYSVSLAAGGNAIEGTYDFADAVAGYDPITATEVTVTRTGTGDITNLAVALSGADAASFTITDPVLTTLDGTNESTTFTIKPNNDLVAGTYTATVTVTADNSVSEAFDITFEVIPTYAINIAAVAGGGTATVTTTPATETTEGTEVTVNISNIQSGYRFASIEVMGSVAITTTQVTEGEEYTFDMPAEAVTVTVTVEEIPTYAITIATVVGGTADVTTTPATEAVEAATVTVNIANIESGKKFSTIAVVGADLTPYTTTEVTPGAEYTFTMPAQAVTVTVTLVASDLFFSEYIEGSSSNKALEIYNGTGSEVDLSNYTIKASNNGAGWGIPSGETVEDTRYILPLSGTLADGEVLVLANASAGATILGIADYTYAYSNTANGCDGCNVLSFNGDDGLALFKSDVIIDQIGVDTPDPGDYWAVADVATATKDHTLVRKDAIVVGNTDWAASAGTNADNSEWIVNDVDIFTFLGWHIAKSSEKDIVTFTLAEQTGAATINADNQTVFIEVERETVVTALVPTITVSSRATIDPASGAAQDFTSPVEYTVTAQDGTSITWTVTVTVAVSTEATVTSAVYTVNSTENTITNVPLSETLANFKANLTPAAGATFEVYESNGTTVATTLATGHKVIVTAEDDVTTKTYTVTLNASASTEAEILAYSINSIDGVINDTDHTIAVTVPFGTDVTALVATFTLSGGATAKVGTVAQVSGTTANDFTNPVIYNVTAEDNTTVVPWTVTVTLEPGSDAAEILTYSLPGQVGDAVITPGTTEGTIAITVPNGTDVAALIATFTLSEGATAKVGDVAQVSGTTANNFTSPVVYVVTAENTTTTKNWTVTVTITEPSMMVDFETEENWTADGSLSSYANHSYQVSGVTVQGTNVLRNGVADQDGFPGALDLYSMRIRNAESNALITIATGGVSDFSLKVRRWDGDPLPNFSVKYSLDEGTEWTSLTNIDGTLLTTSDWFTYTGTINSENDNIQIEIAWIEGERIMIDNFEWSGYSAATDNEAPTVTFAPADAATDVLVDVLPTITFNEAVRNIDDSEITSANVASLITLTDPSKAAVAFTAAINDAKKVITITPDADLANEVAYTITLAPVEDASDNATTEQSATFTTISATTPVLDLTSTHAGPYYVGDEITVTWTSANIENVAVEMYTPSTETWAPVADGAASVVATLGTYTFTIPATTPFGTAYKLRVKNAAADTPVEETAAFTIRLVVGTIAELRELADGDEAKYTGTALVTFAREYRNQKYIKDATAAILVDDNSGVITSEYLAGSKMAGLIGKIDIYNAMYEFIPLADPGTAVSTGNAVTPMVTDLASLTSDHQAQLVRIPNVAFTETGTFESGTNYDIEDASGSKAAGVFRTSFSEADYIGQAIPEGTMNAMIALVGEYNGTIQLTSRFAADFIMPAADDATLYEFTVGGIDALSLAGVEVADPATDAGATLTVADFTDFVGIVVTPNQNDATVTVTLNGAAVAAGDLATQAIAEGDVIVATVVAGDETTTKHYKVTTALQSTETYTVTFNIVDAEANAITDAIVQLGTVTNVAGDYVFDEVGVGSHNYKVTKEGFISVSGVVEVVDQDVAVNITLLEGLVFELPFAEVFDGEGAETPDTWLPDGWSAIDSDGDTYNWYWGYRESDENGSMRSESWSSETQDALTPDNWLITPAIDLSTEEVGVKLSFKVAPTATTPEYRQEHYSVLISTTNAEAESFESIYEETLNTDATGWVYVQKEIDLTEYKGSVVYIAFRHHDVTDMDRITLDDINVFATGIGVETEALANLVAYPNPFSDYITVKSEAKVSRVVVTNLIGQTVMNLRMDGTEGMISTSNLPRGIYLITFEGENGDRVVRKMIKE